MYQILLNNFNSDPKNRYLKHGKTGMTIMEVGVFSGFTPDKDSLIEVNELGFFCRSFLPFDSN